LGAALGTQKPLDDLSYASATRLPELLKRHGNEKCAANAMASAMAVRVLRPVLRPFALVIPGALLILLAALLLTRNT
jgi:hypothetical protein